MTKVILRKNSYQDSITLMLLTNAIAELDGVNKTSIMMGTPANKDILRAGGFDAPEMDRAGPNDIVIAMDLRDEGVEASVLVGMDDFLARQGTKADSTGEASAATSWDEAFAARPDANLVLLSIPGAYVETEVEIALDAGKHVFIFSDNVPLAAEQRLKEKAAAKGLLVMGPDCGTALLGGVPLAFANVIPKGNIGVVGASGTGIQEVTTQIARRGGGISHAIGTGGRDTGREVSAATMKAGIAALAADPATDCILVVSKPPADTVKTELLGWLRGAGKPAAVHFLGESFPAHEEGLCFADTLEEAAVLAVALAAEGRIPETRYAPEVLPAKPLPAGKKIRGLYTGGTLAGEAAVMIERALGVGKDAGGHKDGYMLHRDGHTVVDLGDDAYTQGKPHPMIAPQNRNEFILRAGEDESVGVILLDVVLGYGSHDDLAGETVPAIREALRQSGEAGRDLRFVACICGAEGDPQDYTAQKRALEAAGVLVADSNASAVATALGMLGLAVQYPAKPVRAAGVDRVDLPPPPPPVKRLLEEGPIVVNAGLRSFTKPLVRQNIPFVQLDWQPLAGGDVQLQRMLAFLNHYGKETEAAVL